MEATFKKLSLVPGDVLLLMVDYHISTAHYQRMNERLKEYVPDGVKVVILSGVGANAVKISGDVLKELLEGN